MTRNKKVAVSTIHAMTPPTPDIKCESRAIFPDYDAQAWRIGEKGFLRLKNFFIPDYWIGGSFLTVEQQQFEIALKISRCFRRTREVFNIKADDSSMFQIDFSRM